MPKEHNNDPEEGSAPSPPYVVLPVYDPRGGDPSFHTSGGITNMHSIAFQLFQVVSPLDVDPFRSLN